MSNRFHQTLSSHRIPSAIGCGMLALMMCCLFTGCGTTKSVTATEQLLMSDAVDSSISKLDFRPMSGYKVYLDTTYLTPAGKPTPGVPSQLNLVNSDYVISALRQQLTAAGCMLADNKDSAEIICEARCGALGTDANSMTYGIPPTNMLNSASTVISGAPPIPIIPEISFAKKESKSAAAKVAIFAYDKETREPLWQSGIAQAGSTARDTWLLGIGPIQRGSIYHGTRFAGKKWSNNHLIQEESRLARQANGVDYRGKYLFAGNKLQTKREEKERIAASEKKEDAEPKKLATEGSANVRR